VKEVIHGSGRILVVDDEEIMRITAEELLKYLGYDVLLAADGKEGADIFAKEHDKIDLVMLDMVMPVMNGRECFRELKRIDPAVKVVISSGFVLDDSLNEMRASGLAGFIKKPFQTADLSRVVSNALAERDEKSRVCHD
jgi:CheY-like chemotaxis protein